MGFELITEMNRLQKELTKSISLLRSNGSKLAQMERDYKIELRQQALILRADGVAVTLIDKIVYGVPSVAEARFKRDEAQCLYDANREHLNVVKLQLRVLGEQYRVEFGNGG